MSVIGWIVAIGILAIALYALLQVVIFPSVYRQWETEDDDVIVQLKRRYRNGEISQATYQYMNEMHARRGYCEYCRAYHHRA